MKIVSIMWNAYVPILQRAAAAAGVDLTIFPNRTLEESPDQCEKALRACESADVLLLYRTSHMFWTGLESGIRNIRQKVPVICIGYEPAYWELSTVEHEVAANCYAYLTYNGEENLRQMFRYIRSVICHTDETVPAPTPVPWQGIYHPDSQSTFVRTEEYLAWYCSRKEYRERPWAGLLLSRVAWVSQSLAIEDTLIRELEAEGLNVIPVFTYSIRDDDLGAKGMAEVIREYLTFEGKPRVQAIVKLVSFMVGAAKGAESDAKSAETGSELLARLNIPVFQPVITFYKSLEDWETSPGITDDVTWCVAMPEFEGVIEPVMIGASSIRSGEDCTRIPVRDGCGKVAQRVKRWVTLANKPVQDRKIVFLLNNNPCSSAEANVGSAAHLDSLESVARILRRMKDAGYTVQPPESGKALISTIMERKAISEFRWTSTDDIVASGGVLATVSLEEYLPYFSSLSPKIQAKVRETWGAPPGQGMVHDGKMLITGVQYGNVLVCVQPKRGCYGSRCDGQVCKILHDPECPPPHQYLATYHYFESGFDADAVVHVGTHGNLEFLPGKMLALSRDCFPDAAIGSLPNIYIYNSDNPPEGTIAKRRGYATLVDHMQTVMTQGELYEDLAQLELLLAEYETARNDPARGHALQHHILDAIEKAHLDKDIHATHEMPLDEMVRNAHEALSRIRNTMIQSGMHTFGENPAGEARADFITAILRFDSGDASPQRVVAALLGYDFDDLIAHQDRFSREMGKSYGALIEEVNLVLKAYILAVISGTGGDRKAVFSRETTPDQEQRLESMTDRIRDIDRRIESSKEIDSLLNAFSGGHVPAGPSGLITRGHDDVLPTGRNFYSLDPFRVPTRAAWRVGERLAESMIAKYEKEQKALPETVAFYWMASDIMSADGEMLAEMFALLGVRPVWSPNGQVRSFTIIPRKKAGYPRIDIAVRMSGIIRDNFSRNVELLDKALQAVAALDEPPELNYVRKHALARMNENGGDFRDATLRLFGSKPGTYSTGVNLAILASAWKDEKDLSDIFVAWNGYAYGEGVAGKPSHAQFASTLSTVSLTFNKVASDEYDLLGCCCYFGNHGGITAAARQLSGKEVKAYYGDTREPTHVEVRELSDEIRRVVRTKLLNPKWIDGMQKHGYKGAADIMKRVTRVYGWEASTREVDDWIFDDIAETFVLDPEMKQFFEENNPYALEEIARRLLEAEARGLWNAEPEILEGLKSTYLEIESWMEDRTGNGEYQGGNIDIYSAKDVEEWGAAMEDLLKDVKNIHGRKNP